MSALKVNGEANRFSEACDYLKRNLPPKQRYPLLLWKKKKNKKKATISGGLG